MAEGLLLVAIVVAAWWAVIPLTRKDGRPLSACALCGWVVRENPSCPRCNRHVEFPPHVRGMMCPHCQRTYHPLATEV